MRREPLLLAVAIMAILGTACQGGSPAEPSPQPTPIPPIPPPSTPAPLTDQQFKDRLEALMLGSGPNSQPGNHGCLFENDRYRRWAESLETMRVLLSNKTSERQREELRSVFGMYREILGGRPSLQEELVDVFPPSPATGARPVIGMIKVDVVSELSLCPGAGAGCFSGSGPDYTYDGGLILLRTGAPDATASHEAGHMIGMCHIIGISAGTSIMSGATSPTSLDRRVIETVIRSGLRPGSTRADFVAKGLL